MQNLVVVICFVVGMLKLPLLKEKNGFISKPCRYCIFNQTGKHMQTYRFQKSVMVEAKIFHELCGRAALTRHF